MGLAIAFAAISGLFALAAAIFAIMELRARHAERKSERG